MDSQQKIVTRNAILEQEQAIDHTKIEIATRKEMIADHIEKTQEWLDVEAAKEELLRLRQALAAKLSSDPDYNNQLEDLGQLKDKLKSEKETLSDLIVGYFANTKEHQLEVNNHGDAREVVITGKLGKKGKYQTNLFADKK